MHINKKQIEELDKIKRLNLINSITGIKPANLIGTISNNKTTNLAIFSSVVHLGSNPALIGFILRPNKMERRNTYDNILETGYYTINHIHDYFIEKAHYTSAKFDADVSEFEECKLTKEYLEDFKAPFVKESKLKMGLKFLEGIPIPANGTMLIVGEIQYINLPAAILEQDGSLNLEDLEGVGISGLDTYYRLKKITSFPYARPNELPIFQK